MILCWQRMRLHYINSISFQYIVLMDRSNQQMSISKTIVVSRPNVCTMNQPQTKKKTHPILMSVLIISPLSRTFSIENGPRSAIRDMRILVQKMMVMRHIHSVSAPYNAFSHSQRVMELYPPY